MMQAVLVALAVVVGTVLGYWIRSRAGQAEKELLEQRALEAAAGVERMRGELAAAQADAGKRAGFESLAEERERTIAAANAEREAARTDLRATQVIARDQAARISRLEAELSNERQKTPENLALLQEAQKTLAHQFEALAANVLDQKSKTFSEGSQKELGTLLTPLKEQIKEFREKVEQAQSDSKTGVTRLETLVSTLNGLNQQLSEEARNLSTALRGSAKTQGDWGEFILRDLLDKAGLREGEQYSFQETFAGADAGNGERARSVRTDVVIYLPGGRHLVIDSKVSLTAYTDCVGAETEEARKAALKQHIASVRGHIGGLSKAGYHQISELEAPDFVVMFVPIEPAFLLALQSDGELWADAYKQGILLVGPTTLLYVIRIVNVLWQQERQARNVRDVMERGSALYEKFVGFVTDMEVIGDSLRRTDEHYTSAMKKLADGPGNLIRQVEMLKKLGLRTTKTIPKKLLDRAAVDQEELALSAEAEENR